MSKPQLKKRHEPADVCEDWHCYFHDVDEVFAGNAYRRCFECWHLYRSRRELVWEWAKMHWRFGREDGRSAFELIADILKKKADDIYFCQHCTHDF